jgi:hypothetical protein
MTILNQYDSANPDSRTGLNIYTGIYEGVVRENKDALYMGRLAVYIPEVGGNIDDPKSWVTVRYASPFYGITPYRDNAFNPTPLQTAQEAQAAGSISPSQFRQLEGSPLAGTVDNLVNNGQSQRQGEGAVGSQGQEVITSYGMWAVPPDLGVTVLVMFIGGNLNRGFWFACVPTVAHGMVPAIGAPDGKTPMAEFNPIDPQVPVTQDLTSIQRQPYQPLVDSLTAQGLQEDPLRGPITSSSFREAPSNVFGISSKGGHTFVMDDGSQEGTSKLIRLRTSGGNQITMHDDTGMIYLINAQGTGWIELSPSGQIDVFGAAGINMATNGDVNFHADKNVNIHAGECVKIVGMKGTKVQGGEELQLHGAKTMIEGVDSLHVHSCKEMMFTSFGDIHMKAFNYFCLKGKCFYWNSCTAKEAEQVPPEQPEDVSGYQTTVARAPSKEPYKEHDGGQGAGGGGGAAPDGSASGTGPGGMFDGGGTTGTDTGQTSLGNNFSLGFETGLTGNNPNTSLGNNFSLPIRTGLPGNAVGSGANNWGSGAGQTQPRDAGTTLTQSRTATGSSMGMSFTGIQQGNSSITQPSSPAVAPAAARTTNLQGAVRTSSGSTVSSTYKPATSVNNTNVTANAALSGSFTTNYGVNKPSTITVNTTTPTNSVVTADAALSGSFTTNYANAPTTSSTTIPVSSPAANPYLGRGGAQPVGADPALANVETPGQQPAGVFGSPNPADQQLTGATPAQEANTALDQAFGQSPSSDLPAAPGGGGTGCFATGDNCDRPADETGGGQGFDGDPNANAGQTNYASNDPEGKAAAEAYLGRPMSDSEYNALVAATAAEAGTNQTEQAWVSGTILNRTRARGPNATVQSVLAERNQFEAVTGKGRPNFLRGPTPTRAASINGSMTNILSSVPKTNYYFDAANPAAYTAGRMPTNRAGVLPTRIGASRFYPGARWP